MSNPRQYLTQPRPEELEETAELPALPDGSLVAGDTEDTHVMPAPDALARTDSWQVSIESASAAPAGQIDDKLRALTRSLRELEDRLQAKSEQLSVFEREVGTREQRIAELEAQLATMGTELQDSRLRAEQRGSELLQVSSALDAAQVAQREQFATLQAQESERVSREAARMHAETQALQAQRRNEQHDELLQTVEVRRQLFECMVGEREQQLDDYAARIAALEQTLSDQGRVAGSREQDMQSVLVTERNRAEQLQRLLNEARQTAATQQTQLHQAALREQELPVHLQSIATLREQLEAARSRGDAALVDLSVAEQELRQLEQRLEKQGETEAQLRQQLLESHRALEERNGLIARLEQEAASSAAVLGNIEKNLRRLDAESVPAAAATPVDTVVRLLVCTEGDTGIVHRLGRRTTIGRTPDNDLQIDADYISRHHAVLLITASGTVIEDLDSTNGVYVNGKRVSRAVLNEGELVTIGRRAFRYVHKPAMP